VTIENVSTGKSSGKVMRFPCGDWLSSDNEEQTFRYLYPLSKRNPLLAKGMKGREGKFKCKYKKSD
jgi:hypothetical protein